MVGALLVVAFGVHLLTFQPGTWWGDSFQYLLHAESLISGRPYADTGYIPSPYSFLAPAAYPVGYPLLIAPVLAVFGPSPQALGVVASVCLLGTAWLAATMARAWVPDPFAVAVAGGVAFQPGLLASTGPPLSDLPFMFFVVLSLLAADRASRQRDRWGRWAVLAGLAVGAAVATRTLGVVLVPALLLPGVIRSRRFERWALVAMGIGLVLVVGVASVDLGAPASPGVGDRARSEQGADAGRGADPGYGALVRDNLLGRLSQIPTRIPAQVTNYARASYPLWEVPGASGLKNLLSLLALVPVGIGVAHCARRRFGATEAFAVLYVMALLPWSFSGVRYLFPVYPLYYLYLVVGVWWIGRDNRSRQRVVVAALAVAVGVSYGGRFMERAVEPVEPITPTDEEALYDFIRETTPDGAVMLTTQDARIPAYYTRRAVSLGPKEVGEWTVYADRLGASYALVQDQSEVAPALRRDPRHRLVRRSRHLAFYRVCPSACEASE